MSFTKVCSVGDIWEGEMEPFTVDGHEILLVGVEGGDIKAFQGSVSNFVFEAVLILPALPWQGWKNRLIAPSPG